MVLSSLFVNTTSVWIVQLVCVNLNYHFPLSCLIVPSICSRAGDCRLMSLNVTFQWTRSRHWHFFGSCRFYIGCDRCQNWYHGRCVGILQSEADLIDEYVCPQCQSTEDAMTVLSPLTDKDYEGLRRVLRSLQVRVRIAAKASCFLHSVGHIQWVLEWVLICTWDFVEKKIAKIWCF